MDIFEQIKGIIAGIGKEKNPDKIKLDSTLDGDLGFDSLAAIELIYALENEFKIKIEDNDFRQIKIKDILNYIESQIKNQPHPLTYIRQSKNQYINSLQVDKSLAQKIDFNPYYRDIKSGLGARVKIEGRNYISLGSNDYLGLANDKRVKEGAKKIIDKYGLSMCSTPITLGKTEINRELEQIISSWLKQEDTILFPSCYQANLGAFYSLTANKDLVIADEGIHSSLINGALLAGACLKFFPHNDTDKLKEALKDTSGYRMRFICIEGLYSINGDIPPLDKISSLAEEYDAFLIVDDAHGIGILGDDSQGISGVFPPDNSIDLISGSLGKALGVFGGFLSGTAKVIDHLRYSCPMYFYSTSLPAHIAAAAISAINIIRSNPKLRKKIFSYKEKLYTSLKNMGYRLTESQTPLFAILFKDELQTLKMAKLLSEENIYAVPFIAPSVPKESPRIRLLASACLEDKDIEKVIQVFKKLRFAYAP